MQAILYWMQFSFSKTRLINKSWALILKRFRINRRRGRSGPMQSFVVKSGACSAPGPHTRSAVSSPSRCPIRTRSQPLPALLPRVPGPSALQLRQNYVMKSHRRTWSKSRAFGEQLCLECGHGRTPRALLGPGSGQGASEARHSLCRAWQLFPRFSQVSSSSLPLQQRKRLLVLATGALAFGVIAADHGLPTCRCHMCGLSWAHSR